MTTSIFSREEQKKERNKYSENKRRDIIDIKVDKSMEALNMHRFEKKDK